jgi:nicotinamide-nucleotide amidase
MPNRAEILSQGDEVVTGQIADTNAAWLSEQLVGLGFDVVRHTTVGDRQADIVEVLREIAQRADVCVCTGGLGPTADDLTSGAVAEAFDRPQELDLVALAQIEDRFRAFGRVMAPVNRRQALLPRGSERLDNSWGTAPGFAFSTDRRGEGGGTRPGAVFFCLPGVPVEMKQMFEARVLPRLVERFAVVPGRLVTLRTVGVGESDVQQALEGLSVAEAVLGFRTRLPENHVKLRFPAGVSEEVVHRVVTAVLERIGRWVFTVEGVPEHSVATDTGGGDLAAVVGRALVARGETLAVAESCTGGRVAAACTAWPGSSAWFTEGAVTYTNASKVRLLGVSASDLATHGAVSEPVAIQMAEGIRLAAGATWGIGITGIAGPDRSTGLGRGGTEEKPVGTVHLAVAGPRSAHRVVRFPGHRERIQILSVAAALELLRRELF